VIPARAAGITAIRHNLRNGAIAPVVFLVMIRLLFWRCAPASTTAPKERLLMTTTVTCKKILELIFVNVAPLEC
jgi:hypothetical protein